MKSDQTTPETKDQEPTYKKRLLVGEADLSYTAALLKKHKDERPTLGAAVIATEYRTEEQLEEEPDFANNRDYATSQGATVLLGIDATKLHESKEIEAHLDEDGTIPRIHFNCPYVGNDSTTKQLVAEFFSSASQIQKEGDRIYMALPQARPSKRKENSILLENARYDIQSTINKEGYQLFKKRKFMDPEEKNKRYPDYNHAKTQGGGSADSIVRYGAREFIFAKTNQRPLHAGKKAFPFSRPVLPDIDSSSDSSDYENSPDSPSVKKRKFSS